MTAEDQGTHGRPPERRKYPRIGAKHAVVYRMLSPTEPLPSITTEMGAGGIRLLTGHELPPSTPLSIEIQVRAGEDPIRFTGQVIWSRCVSAPSRVGFGAVFEVGVAFLKIAPEVRQAILDLVEQEGKQGR